jgi:DNA polymerase-1
VSPKFGTAIFLDFEFETEPGGLQRPLCMVAYILDEHLAHVRTVRQWRDDFGLRPPFDTGPNTVFVAYAAWAELQCFLQLGWRFPEHVLDLHTAYLALSNVLYPFDYDETRRRKEKKGLVDACRAYCIQGWEKFDKSTIAKDIGEGNWRIWGRETVFDYCEEDVRKTAELLRAMLRGSNALGRIDIPRVLYWSEYSSKAVARIQTRGMPIDKTYWDLVQENKALVIGELLRRFDPSQGTAYPIYTPEGEWTLEQFEKWLYHVAGVRAWPRLESGQLDMSGDAFRMMAHAVKDEGNPLKPIERLHALRDSIGFISKARLPIGPDNKNRPSLFPFGAATGRNAHARSPFNAHAAVRSFMLFEPGEVGFYLDWRSQEVAVAAARFGDEVQRREYEGGDVYHALALMCGLTNDPDPVHWKAHNGPMRDRIKPIQLGINYGEGVMSLAKNLDRHPIIAGEILWRYAKQHPKFWQGRLAVVEAALNDRIIMSASGWPLRLTHSPNKRSILNFPMQAGGAEMLRLATVRLVDAGIVPIMLVHDGILFGEKDVRRIPEAIEIMRVAGRELCEGINVGVDVSWSSIDGGDQRFRDKRPMAKAMWGTIEDVLRAIGALRRENAA